ncbi:IclR family transcriptional regulator [Pseudoglutamicibacter cumminsii]|uniref:IclR family transcriptional regulator n=1 Tax=Pseudoglutamicibacter cumminsii TaxID=156979 RepID=UPI0021A487E1|nr:helix-turn-helix domain-containing protein [Pseudoglutamicibacter cumminsii]MCT1686745.1 helix-turn-helix domain-containing protein [Pseudoglutamicibacter cumminsii]
MAHEENRTHVLDKAAVILELVASAGPAGARLLDLAEDTGISRPTVHRILASLREIGYVQQLPSKRYTLGVRLGLLGLAAPTPLRRTSELQEYAQDLADEIGDTVYIAIQYFDSVYYLARAHGPFPVRMQTVEVGDLQPLTSTYSGLAILSQLPREQQERMVDNLDRTERSEWSEIGTEEHQRLLREAIEQFKADGFLYGDEYVLPGLSGAAVLVPNKVANQRIAVSVSAISARLPESRKDAVIKSLNATARKVQETLGAADEGYWLSSDE